MTMSYQAYNKPPLPKRSPAERKETGISNEIRKQMVPYWEERRIALPEGVEKTFDTFTRRKIDMIREKVEAYDPRKLFFRPELSHEDAGMLAERMVAEGFDLEGGCSKQGGRWLGNEAASFLASEYDDAMSGGDVLVAIMDPDDETVALPLVIDVTTSQTELDKKDIADRQSLLEGKESRIYWTNPKGFDGTPEGRIPATHASIFISREKVREFYNPDTPPEEAGKIMKDLRLSVVLQLRKSLQLHLLFLLNEVTNGDFQIKDVIRSRYQNEAELLDRAEEVYETRSLSPKRLQELQRICKQLRIISRPPLPVNPPDLRAARVVISEIGPRFAPLA